MVVPGASGHGLPLRPVGPAQPRSPAARRRVGGVVRGHGIRAPVNTAPGLAAASVAGHHVGTRPLCCGVRCLLALTPLWACFLFPLPLPSAASPAPGWPREWRQCPGRSRPSEERLHGWEVGRHSSHRVLSKEGLTQGTGSPIASSLRAFACSSPKSACGCSSNDSSVCGTTGHVGRGFSPGAPRNFTNGQPWPRSRGADLFLQAANGSDGARAVDVWRGRVRITPAFLSGQQHVFGAMQTSRDQCWFCAPAGRSVLAKRACCSHRCALGAEPVAGLPFLPSQMTRFCRSSPS